jgi:hypothetical protein
MDHRLQKQQGFSFCMIETEIHSEFERLLLMES